MSRVKPKYLMPEEAIILREATRRACERAVATSDFDRETIADAVLWLSECGYARLGDGTLDAGVLAEAAALQFWNRNAPPKAGLSAFLW